MTDMRGAWRLLVSGPASGARNMAIDEALLESTLQGDGLPILRLYAWEPPCLSLGHAQAEAAIDFDGLQAQGWDWVRRPTGGRALLHADEITYAVAAPAASEGFAGGVLAAYQFLSRGLLVALTRLGLSPDPPSPASVSVQDRQNPVCFEVPSSYELTVGGRKIIGSAQLRRRGGILQHGSLPLRGDITRVVRALRFDGPAAREAAADRLARHATTLEAALGRTVAWETAAEALAAGFREGLEIDLLPSQLSSAEEERAAQLEATRLASRPAPEPSPR
jgi:lipoate-protein ligase A